MNEFRSRLESLPTSQEAEGLPRLGWSLAAFDSLIEAGILTEDDRVELIGGELVPMSPKDNRHEKLKSELIDWIGRRLPEDVRLSIELGWRPGGDRYLEPDFILFPQGHEAPVVAPEHVLLIIAVADTSLRYDTGIKARVYARLGVREDWVIDANTLETTVHLAPSAEGYGSVATHPAPTTLTPTLLPALSPSLAALGLR